MGGEFGDVQDITPVGIQVGFEHFALMFFRVLLSQRLVPCGVVRGTFRLVFAIEAPGFCGFFQNGVQHAYLSMKKGGPRAPSS
ncbi:hypothetical protein DV532_29895 (plasmid) [Pseudomonas sp. Leaf58]|nr:hypothetical protein DV532_29895 [Pseudomonas sp. Leaf58]KQN62010.1 hypothetical protein ASF02_07425 [Pseudomonas sp. Leaf58]